ncbi:MAG: hypothetical protein ABI459_08375 [Deltaproteobacteria bacterium]
MERVAFLIEATGERVTCLLNPESLTFTRQAGLRTRSGGPGTLMGGAGADDPLIVSGGGITELELQLLFDTELAQSLDPSVRSIEPALPTAETPLPAAIPLPEPDVRTLTRPLWNLAEPCDDTASTGDVPVVRFIWGRAWNVPAVVIAVAEKLERFGSGGVPQRSWLSLRLRRVPGETASEPDITEPVDVPLELLDEDTGRTLWAGDDATYVQAIADADGNAASQLYQLADEHLGSPQSWPVIAAASGIEDPLRIAAGTIIVIPDSAQLGSA